MDCYSASFFILITYKVRILFPKGGPLMDAINYRLDTYEGPLDLLLTLIQKNKMSIDNIQINVICEQYIEYIEQAQSLDMELASEFLVMASELMLIKTKLLLPKPEAEEEDPRTPLADALLKYQQAKEAAQKMALLYPRFSGRLEKDTDEISVDKTFVADQEIESLCIAVRRIITYNENRPKIERSVFTPMISSPIVPVEVKIAGILGHMAKKGRTSLKELLDDSVSLPDMIAIFLGVLELIKIRKILICDCEGTLLDDSATFIINDNPQDIEKDADGNELYSSSFDEKPEQTAIQFNTDDENDKGEHDA